VIKLKKLLVGSECKSVIQGFRLENNYNGRGAGMRACRKLLFTFFVILLCFFMSACSSPGGKVVTKKNGSTDSTTATATATKTDGSGNTSTSTSPDGGTWPQWKNDALQLSFNYPPDARITVTPDGGSLVDIYISDNVSVGIRIVEAQSKNEAEFVQEMKRRFTVGYPDSLNDFLEYTANYNKVSGYPAAYIEYRWNVMKTDMRTMEQSVLKGKYEITMYCVYKLSDDSLYLDTAREIIGSLKILSGEIKLNSLSSNQGVQPKETTAGQTTGTSTAADGSKPADSSGGAPGSDLKLFTKYPIALTGPTCDETGVQKTIGAEFGKDVSIADWEFLKSAYGEMLPAVMADLGLENEGIAWVSRGGEEFVSSNNHYFIQRFDSGKPAGFLAYDRIDSIYLGSWYGLNIRVLAYKNPE